jgi:hypothetical protein
MDVPSAEQQAAVNRRRAACSSFNTVIVQPLGGRRRTVLETNPPKQFKYLAEMSLSACEHRNKQ